MSKLKDYLTKISESRTGYNKSAVDKQKKKNGVGEEEGRMIDRLLKGRTAKKPSPEVKEESTEKNLSLQEQYAEYFTRMGKNSKRNKLL